VSNFGQAALTIGGAALGFVLPGVGWAIGATLGSMAGSALFPTDLGTVSGPRLNDLNVQSSAVGAPIPIVYGTYAISGNVIWSSGIIEAVSKKKQGGKGGPTQTTKTYSYSVNCAVGVCEGEVNGISRIWADAKLIYDARPQLDGESDADYAARAVASAALLANAEIYLGSAAQLADPTIESFEGVGNVSAFRDLVYVVFSNFQLDEYGNRIPNFRFEVSTVASGSGQQVFTTSGTWVRPSSVGDVTVTAIGGGGGAGGGAVGNSGNAFVYGGQGGGGGGISVATLALSALGGTETVTVGAGGAGGLGADHTVDEDGLDGTAGGSSSFGSHVTAGGGGAGKGGTNGSYWALNDNNGGSGTTSSGGHGATWGPNTVQSFGSDEKPNGDNSLGAGAGGAGGTSRFSQLPKGVDGGDGADSPNGLYEGGTGGHTDRANNTGVTSGENGAAVTGYVAGAGGGGGGLGGYTSPQEPGAAGANGGNGSLYGGGGGGGGGALAFGAPASIAGDGGFGAAGVVIVSVAGVDDGCITLGEIVSDLCLRAGLAAEQIDVSDLTECVDGYVVSRVMSARDAISPLRSYGWFDCVESDGVLKWPTRGKAAVFDFTADDLAAHIAGDSRPSSAETDRQQEVELPRRLRVHYAQTEQNYEPGEQGASRLAAGDVEVRDMEVAVAMSDTKAARIADVVLYDLWVARNRIRTTVDHSWLHLEPADAGTMPIDGRQERVRIVNIDHALPGLLRVDLVRDDDGVYESYAIGAPAAYAGTGGGSLAIVGTADLVLLDLPLLRDTDNDAGYYAAVRAIGSTSFGGAVIYRSPDGGTTYQEVATATLEATLGELVSALPAGPTDEIDATNELLVSLDTGTLESISEVSLAAGLNAAAIGADGRWEIIQFRDAEYLGSPPYWRLTGLLRGRRGSDCHVGTSLAGDRFVFLDSAIVRVPLNVAALGIEQPHKAVLVGRSLETTDAVNFTGQGVALKPFSPYNAEALREDDGDIVISWDRRSRLGLDTASGPSVPLAEESELYEIDIVEGASVIRTITATTATATWTAAQQTSDFGSPVPDGLLARIYQISGTVGRGCPAEVALSLGAAYRIRIRVPSSSVTATLTDFPVFVDLADLPSGFWDHVEFSDGRDIRVKTGAGADIPFDLVRFDPEARRGSLFYRQTLSSSADTDAYIHYDDPSRSAVPVGAANGRNAVWAGYHRVFMFGDDFVDRTGNGSAAEVNGTLLETFDNVSTSADLGVHQGVCWDGEHYYVVDTNAIKKYDSSFTLVTSNSNPIASVSGTDHCGDPEIINGVLYIPMEQYTNITTWSAQHVARFNASDLSFIGAVDVSAQGHEVSSCCYNPDDGYLYVSSYADGSKLWRYDPDDLSYVSSLSLSSTIAQIQGVTYWRRRFWINSDSLNATVCVESNGTVRGRVWGITGGNYEGIGHTDDALLLMHDTTGSSNGVVRRLEPRDVAAGGGALLSGSDSYLLAPDITRYTTWTAGVTASISAKGANCAIVSYAQEGVATNSIRATLSFNNTSDRWGLWNTTDLWILGSASPTVDQRYRLNVTHNGTTNRKLYVDGINEATDTTISARPDTTANCLYIGMDDSTLGEDLTGEVGFVYLRASILTDDWISAEARNLSGGSPSFYTVSAEEPL
jgi:hypothetical protein